jgi:glycine betaine/choline ABC-type transport system substrate-binding protein
MLRAVELAVRLHLLRRHVWTVRILSKYFCVLWSFKAIQKIGTQSPTEVQISGKGFNEQDLLLEICLDANQKLRKIFIPL